MKKNSKKQTKATLEQFVALGAREENTLVIGIDVGDRNSHFCVRTREGALLMEGSVETKPEAMATWMNGWRSQRMVIETGTHSRWIAELLKLMGHEVIVANARKLKLITENENKSDKVDAQLLSKLGATAMEWLHPVYQRRADTHLELTMVRARNLLVEQRTTLVNYIRGVAKSEGVRLPSCSSESVERIASEQLPATLRAMLSGVLHILAQLNEQIRWYDRQIEHACNTKYGEQTRWVLQVKGVGPVTALTYVLTIEDPERFKNSRSVGTYLGLVRKKRQSGQRDPQLGISKAGDEMLRKLLVNCAHHILGPKGADSDLRRWGLRLVEAGLRAGNRRARKRAATAVARKLAVLLHVLWSQQREYDPLRVSKALPAAA